MALSVLFYNLNNTRFNNYLLCSIILSVEMSSAYHNYTLTSHQGKRTVEIKRLDFLLSDHDQTVWYDLLPHSGTLAFQIWTVACL